MENKNYIWRPVSEYTGGRVLTTNGLDVLIGEINSEGDCETEEDGSTILCGITGFIKIEEILPESKDEKIRKEIIAHIKWCEDSGYCAKEEMTRWITFLEKQGEQKPTDEEMKELLRTEYEKGRADAIAEMQKPWSEEDGAMFNFIALILRNHQSDEDFTTFETTFKDCIDWLKSLKDRYTWKPSDRELGAILAAIGDERQKGSDVAKELLNIYQQLKKLKE